MVTLTLFGPSSAAATDPDPAQTVIDQMLDALGGRAAIAELRSLAVEAECTGPGGAFRTTVDSFRPGLVYFQQDSSESTTRIWSTPERTWTRLPDDTLQNLGDPVRYFVRAHEFHFLLFEIESRFSDHRMGAVDSSDDPPCQRIDMLDESRQPASICIAETSGHPLWLEMNPEGAEGSVNVTFENWRSVDGLEYFSAFRLTEGAERVFTYSYQRIEPNVVAAQMWVDPPEPEQHQDHATLLEILRGDRRAHLETDASLLASHLSESLVEVSGGQMRKQSRAEIEALFTTIFDGASYEMWEDTTPPIVRISSDSTLAWVIRTVRVRRTATGSDGRPASQAFTSAYTATYEKQEGSWRMTSVTSTFLAPTE